MWSPQQALAFRPPFSPPGGVYTACGISKQYPAIKSDFSAWALSAFTLTVLQEALWQGLRRGSWLPRRGDDRQERAKLMTVITAQHVLGFGVLGSVCPGCGRAPLPVV